VDDVVAGLAETWRAIRELIDELTPEDWSRPTPCAEWDVRQLVAHVGGGQSLFEGFPQPAPPPGWSTTNTGVDAITAEGVAARDSWTRAEVIDEFVRATDAQVARFRGLRGDQWDAPSDGPPGITTVAALARNRLLDGYIHLLDLRTALGRSLDLGAEPTALAACVQQALDFTGWGAVKRAGLEDGSRVRLDLEGPRGFTGDLVVEGRRGTLGPTGDAIPRDRVEGTTPAYLVTATARPQWVDQAGGIAASGPVAEQLLSRYVIWA
jgi:uncharacterized protein (TIGR03083 family)